MNFYDKKHFVLSLKLERERIPNFGRYPFDLPVISNLDTLSFHPSVTFFVGENGSGKSTLMEALAVALDFNPEGGTENFKFLTRSSHSPLHEYLRISKGRNTQETGFFLRAESFYNVATEIERLDDDPYGGPRIIDSYGGISLHEQSHGESFFSLMQHRFGDKGLYILDEPEAALSPGRQMAMLSRMHQLVKGGSQFIIATHSPILLAYPDAKIFEIREEGIEQVSYEETDTFAVTKHFLNNHQRMVDMLVED